MLLVHGHCVRPNRMDPVTNECECELDDHGYLPSHPEYGGCVKRAVNGCKCGALARLDFVEPDIKTLCLTASKKMVEHVNETQVSLENSCPEKCKRMASDPKLREPAQKKKQCSDIFLGALATRSRCSAPLALSCNKPPQCRRSGCLMFSATAC